MLAQFTNYFFPQKLFTRKPVDKQEEVQEEQVSPVLKSPTLNGPPDHVAFVIHGIGQQTEKFGFFQKHLQSLYDTTNKAVEENGLLKEVNVEYVPIEWHKHIHEETDAVMDDITLRSIPTMRMVNNDYLADAFFYLSKERGQSIVNHVTQTFNEAYSQFIRKNAGFKGKIAILAYSLGGIITWDILSNQHLGLEGRFHSKLDLSFPKLDFKPDYLFALGSPLSAFMTVRNQDPKVYHPDPSIVFENIFHPFDPLAYRFEPLLMSTYKDEPAMLVDKSSDQDLSPHSTWSKGCELMLSLSRQQQKITALLSGASHNDVATNCNNKEKVNSYPGSTLLFQGGDNIFSALKNYFGAGYADPQPHYITLQEEEDDFTEYTTSTPKLSLDCGSEVEEDEDYFFAAEKDHQSGTSFVYIPHTDMTTATTILETGTTCKRRHSNSNNCYKDSPISATHINKKRRRSNEDIQLLRTTITKGSQLPEQKDLMVEADPTSLPKRIDYVLQPEKFLGCFSKNDYFSGLTAHFSYWTHKDLMWHIVRRLENITSPS